MDVKTYTMASMLVEFDADSDYGKAVRAMPEVDMLIDGSRQIKQGHN
jgi:hypothetical protein